MRIIDIGTCIGIFVDECLQKYENIESIICFEPFIFNYDFLKYKYKDDGRIQIHNVALSNFDGNANLYKKLKPQGYDFVGNAGCSIKKEKGNVSKNHFNVVKVSKLTNYIDGYYDVLKIDSEGCEYDILIDLIDNNWIHNIGKIYYEDHCRKIPGLIKQKNVFINKIKEMGIIEKFYIQSNEKHLDYEPMRV